MIYQETSVILHPDKVAAYLEGSKNLYPIFEKFGAKIVGSWTTIIGNTNEFTVLMAYENMGQLEKSAMAMMQDKDYQTTWQKISPFVMSHTRKLMMSVAGSPLK